MRPGKTHCRVSSEKEENAYLETENKARRETEIESTDTLQTKRVGRVLVVVVRAILQKMLGENRILTNLEYLVRRRLSCLFFPSSFMKTFSEQMKKRSVDAAGTRHITNNMNLLSVVWSKICEVYMGNDATVFLLREGSVRARKLVNEKALL